ncbi:ABC transporter A family member 7-like isoform X2 [Macadamia integrifolia]|uniref:ABC transporter A family member 7-like isoform X2 n=1 Tax=Macadamia integrifolia TaxID=60698 RepID=UPI001C4EA615|nr:ABC transporter A family member 7-like isoform X2 [Macadamia integrifolia]
MADSSHTTASFLAQTNALFRKNLIFQRRNMKASIRLVLFPMFLCLVLFLVQKVVNNELDKDPQLRCGCSCIGKNADGSCKKTVCGIEYSELGQAVYCPIHRPQEWPALLQVPDSASRFPDEPCQRNDSCPATILFTGGNRSLGESVARNFFTGTFTPNSSDMLQSLANIVLGSSSEPAHNNFLEPAFSSEIPVYILQSQCVPNFTLSFPIQIASRTMQKEVRCVQGLNLWCNSSSEINDDQFNGSTEGKSNEIVAAYDFLNSNENNFNVRVWYKRRDDHSIFQNSPPELVRVPRSVNVASNAYLQFLKGAGTKMLLEFVKEMPKTETRLSLDLSSLLGGLFFSWVILQLFPVILTSLVYEKQQKLRIIMKMHGLGDGPYMLISYAYFLFLSSSYMLCFAIFGSLVGLNTFTMNDYSIQFVFYFIYINLQVSFAFLAATVFSNVKTATAIGHICVFGSGLLGAFLFQTFLEDNSFPGHWIIVMELFPAFSLYRVIYEFGQYVQPGIPVGMRWKDLNDNTNGMRKVLILMILEWFVVLLVTYYLDQVVSSGGGMQKHPLFFLRSVQKKKLPSSSKPSMQRQGSTVLAQMEKPDVFQEREKVEQLLLESSTSYAVVCDNIKKVYPGKDGNHDKLAIGGLSLALSRGECFGMLGPNGAGKTSFINVMTGLIKPTSGMALVQGVDLQTDMNKIYTSMGVCPQHDLLWETLTGREHLLFYGRLKNLKGAALTRAVKESLKSVNLFHGGVADRKAGKYSGGMKRRLSVAISLIGNPKIVYMDEPGTGLDPASRKNLWNVIKHAKRDRAIILTTHSMEEAEFLCDRLGILVDGSLRCIGSPKELKARYGKSYVLMITTLNQEEEVENLVHQLSPNAIKTYHLSGTQKFELPKHEVRIADIFQAIEIAKRMFTIQAWGLSDTTLEDVFIKVAQ